MTRFGDFDLLCSQTPSYPWCNLFYRQISKHAPSVLIGASANDHIAPVGINVECGILRAGANGSVGNIPNIVTSAGCMIFVLGPFLATIKRKGAAGRIEFGVFLAMYLLTLLLQLISTGSLLSQGSVALVTITAIHAGTIAALFLTLLANAVIATRVVEDGTLYSLVPLGSFASIFFILTAYISLDVGLGITTTLGYSNPPRALHSVPLFVLTSVWPAV